MTLLNVAPKPIRILRIKEVLNLRGLPKSTFYEHISKGLMTRSVNLGERSVGWPEHEVEQINMALVAGATSDQIKELVTELTIQRQALACA